jgi:hypothetical protein
VCFLALGTVCAPYLKAEIKVGLPREASRIEPYKFLH